MLLYFVIFIVKVISNAASSEVEFECYYKWTKAGNYLCQVQILNKSADYQTLTRAYGLQNIGKTNDDVTIIEGFYLDVTFLPIGFGKIFKKIYAFQIMKSNLTHIKRENFVDMKNLSLLTLSSNLIETFTEDVFYDLQELECLNLANNRIKVNFFPNKVWLFLDLVFLGSFGEDLLTKQQSQGYLFV